MAHEISTPQKNPGSFRVKLEADATSMECVPQTSQPTSDSPGNENATHEIVTPEYMKSDPCQAKFEMRHDGDPLVKEMERITKMREELFKSHVKQILQLQSDYIKEYEMLREKYIKLLQNVDTAEASEYEEGTGETA